eukprot:366285-Chlamydomonas_euryale.AAC.6
MTATPCIGNVPLHRQASKCPMCGATVSMYMYKPTSLQCSKERALPTGISAVKEKGPSTGVISVQHVVEVVDDVVH